MVHFFEFNFQVQAVNKLEIPNSFGFHLWKIQRANLAENWIWPICLFNKNNQQDFQTNKKYEIHHYVSFLQQFNR